MEKTAVGHCPSPKDYSDAGRIGDAAFSPANRGRIQAARGSTGLTGGGPAPACTHTGIPPTLSPAQRAPARKIGTGRLGRSDSNAGIEYGADRGE